MSRLATIAVSLGVCAQLTMPALGVPKGDSLFVREDGGTYSIRARFSVEAPMETVWAVLTDYERTADFVPGVQSSRVKDRSDDHLILEQELKAGFLLFTKRSRLKLRIEEDALRSIEFKDTSHKDFKFYAGSWAIEPLESGTQVVYRLDAKPDFSVPGPVVRVVFERKANELLAGIKGEIIHRASAIRLDGKLWLEGDSTVHSYSSVTTQLSMWIGAEPESGWQQALIGHRPIDFEVEIPVTSLKSGKDGLDSKMYEALDAGKHPTLLFRLRSYEVVAEAGVVSDGSGSENVVHILADGKLSIAGREKDLQLDIQIEFTEDGIRLRGSKTVNMSDFGAEPPTMMAGLLRTHDSVTIRFDVEIASVQEDDAEEDGKAAL